MNIDVISQALLWCVIINYAVLLGWILLLILSHEWFCRLSGKIFHVTTSQVELTNYVAIAVYKIGIILFALVPYIALRIIR